MRFSLIQATLLLGALTAASPVAAPVPESTNSDGIVVQTSPTDSPEAQAEQQNSQQVMCNLYQSTNLRDKSLAPCTAYCGDLVNSKNSSVGSVTCLGGTGVGQTEWYPDSNGDKYTPGVCKCDIPILDELGKDLVEGFAAIGEIGCQIFFGTLDAVLEVATLVIPGAGEIDAADAGMQAAVKLANGVAEKGQDAMDFVNGFLNPCGSGTNYTDSADNLFLPLIGKGKPGRGKGGDKPDPPKASNAPKPSDAPKPSAPATAKPSDKPASATKSDAAPTSASASASAPSKSASTAASTSASASASSQASSSASSAASSSASSSVAGASSSASSKASSSASASSGASSSASASSGASSSAAASSGAPSSASASSGASSASGASSTASGTSKSSVSSGASSSGSTASQTASSGASSASSTASGASSASSPASITSSASSASSASSSATSSSSSSASACGSSSAAAKPTKAAKIKGRGVYPIPDDCEVQQILDYLTNYDTSSTKKDKLIDTIIPKYMSDPTPKTDSSTFYVGDASDQAATQNAINGKSTIASVFHGYSQFPFDATVEPFKSISAKGMQKKWFRATSAAFARFSSGKVFFVYDGDWKTAQGRDGQPSIFNTDELPELQKNSKVTGVYQISTALANLWNPDNEPTLKIMGDITGENPTNGQLPAVQIWPTTSS